LKTLAEKQGGKALLLQSKPRAWRGGVFLGVGGSIFGSKNHVEF
jgi:hypothetical protein